jgi:hypothetical protein
MKKIIEQLPRARKEGLVIEDLPGEVLVYDLERHKAHCLNETAGIVWRLCNGKTSIEAIAERLQRDMEAPVDEEVVWLAIEQLETARLMSQPSRRKESGGLTRRELVIKLGWAAAVGLPLVTSIVAPRAVEAVTCGIVCSGDASCIATPGCPTRCVSGSCVP